MLLHNPQEAIAIRNFVRRNLDGLTVEKMYQYFDEIIIPRIAANFIDANKDEWDEEFDKDGMQCIGKRRFSNIMACKNFTSLKHGGGCIPLA